MKSSDHQVFMLYQTWGFNGSHCTGTSNLVWLFSKINCPPLCYTTHHRSFTFLLRAYSLWETMQCCFFLGMDFTANIVCTTIDLPIRLTLYCFYDLSGFVVFKIKCPPTCIMSVYIAMKCDRLLCFCNVAFLNLKIIAPDIMTFQYLFCNSHFHKTLRPLHSVPLSFLVLIQSVFYVLFSTPFLYAMLCNYNYRYVHNISHIK